VAIAVVDESVYIMMGRVSACSSHNPTGKKERKLVNLAVVLV
jgi:hypothetical protein